MDHEFSAGLIQESFHLRRERLFTVEAFSVICRKSSTREENYNFFHLVQFYVESDQQASFGHASFLKKDFHDF